MLGVFGDLVEDVVVWLHEPVRESSDTDVSIRRTRGGSAANVAAFAGSRRPTRFLGCVGPDATGDRLIAELAAFGVDVKVQRRGRTGTVVVLVDDQGERTMLPDRGASALVSDIDPAWTTGLAHLHVPAYAFSGEPTSSTAASLIRRMHAQGTTVSVDASSVGLLQRLGQNRCRELFADLAPRLLFANRAEADFLGLDDNGITQRTVVIVKDGSRPTAVLVPGRQRLEVPVPPVHGVRDMTGAGDAFAAGFLTAFLSGGELREACEAGHALAAHVLRTPGATCS